jgi:hypothetical protein
VVDYHETNAVKFDDWVNALVEQSAEFACRIARTKSEERLYVNQVSFVPDGSSVEQLG